MARSPRRSDLFCAAHMVYLTPIQKRVFHEAAKRSLSNLNSYIRDLLTKDVVMRAEQGEPYFAGLRDELKQAKEEAGLSTQERSRAKFLALMEPTQVTYLAETIDPPKENS